ncbi:MAG: tetratricopeptide repeat protein [Planctomycetes bacterium]|nr:tetratricopeptide repeat protein [Planctomycetota bacterium]
MYYRKLALAGLVLALLGVGIAHTQPKPGDKDKPAPMDGEIDAVGKQAAALETQLAKTSATSKEGAELQLKLIDLYHEHGRPFGLVRTGQTFVAQHTTHPRHKEAMLKLIDGLRVTGRNKELIATGRQFLARHPGDPAGAEVERWLARLLRKTNDSLATAAVLEAQWKRLGNTPDGYRAGREAVSIYFAVNNAESLAKAAALGEEMLDKLPAGGPATYVGWYAVEAHERLSQWAKANAVGAKLAAKSPPPTVYYLQYLHARMGENYNRLGQHVNAVASWRAALAVPNNPPRPDLHMRLIEQIVQTNPKPGDLEPVVNDYNTKFPARPDRFAAQVRLANAYSADKNPARAEQILAGVLPFDGRSHSASSAYTALFGGDADKTVKANRLAAAEQTLRAAVAKSTPANAAVLRYSLSLELLRDRAQNVPAAKAVARELAFQFPSNDGYTAGAINWLLDAAADDAEFNADVARVVEARRKFPWVTTYRGTLANWAQGRLANKDLAKRAQAAQVALAASNKEPVNADWSAYETAVGANTWSPQSATARAKLLEAGRVAAYPDDVANDLYYQQQYYYRHYAPDAQRPLSIDMAKAWAARLPASFDAAVAYLQHATDFTKPAEFRAAAPLVLKLEPTGANSDTARRLFLAAGHFKDNAVATQAWAWTKKMFDKHGYDNGSAATMGDTLTALGMKAEAKECWERAMTGNPDTHDYYQCAHRLIALQPDAQKPAFIDALVAKDSGWHFSFATTRADYFVKAGDVDAAARLLVPAADKVRDRAFGGQAPENDWSALTGWVSTYRAFVPPAPDAKVDPAAPKVVVITPAMKVKLFTLVRDLNVNRSSMVAQAALVEVEDPAAKVSPMKRLLALADTAVITYGDATDFDYLTPYVQSALARKDYMAAATIMSGLLGHHPNLDEGRRKTGRDILTQAYTRLGAAGGAVIDEKSPIAPLLSAALQLRLGDQKLAFETYLGNQKLFDAHRAEVPVDLLVFVCENHIAAGGDANHTRVEDTLRAWLIKNADLKEVEDGEKARVQLLLGRNYFRSKRFDLARAEFTTLLNRYGKTPLAVEADFGIGETYMEQKVYDQAEQVFERLAGNRDRDIVIRAEFLRGVLASRRGDRDEARAIFRSVLERVPNIDLANQALYNLSEVYGAEQRYVDQLELLRTVGRLGRASKRFHTPGEPLSIVVQDSDLGVSRGHNRIPVLVTTVPGGDTETIYLISGGAGKGLFRADLETRLGAANKNDRILQLTGKDVIRVDYPPEFKKEFKDAPLPDAEIRIAADARLDIASGKITDDDEETFGKKLEREAMGEKPDDKRVGIERPKDQIKPGNLMYLRVKDADRDVSDQPDKITVKLVAASGDTVTATLTETGPHTGVFEGTAKSGELPAGALATNTAIDHSPLMAIDKDRKTAWLSEPDGVTPKVLSIDMKDLKRTDRVTVWTPDAKRNAPIRMTLEGSDDGRMWFRLAGTHPDSKVVPVAGEVGPMSARVYEGTDATGYTTWDQVVALTKNAKATTEGRAADMFWARLPDAMAKKPTAIVWHGKIVQAKTGAARIHVAGDKTAVMIDGRLELPVGPGNRHVDVYLDAGTHALTVFTAAGANTPTLEARWATGDATTEDVTTQPFRASDFDLERPEAKAAPAPRALGEAVADKEGTSWDFKFAPLSVRHVRTVIHEYRGEAVAINHVEVRDGEKNVLHIPTETDLLSLATNDVLEIAGGDLVAATYIDEVNTTGGARLLTGRLTATYYNARVAAIAYDFMKTTAGDVYTIRKELLRIDPGERIVIEVTDYDQDATAGPDKIKVQVSVNNGPPIELEATETAENTGQFTKEIDTSAVPAEGKIVVKPGDRVYLRYVDQQNTVPGHASVREAVVYVNEPTAGRVRIVETRATVPVQVPGAPPVDPTPIIRYLPPTPASADPKYVAGVAFEAPFTVEVIDRDAAKDSRSKVIVKVKTTSGAEVDVECVLDDRQLHGTGGAPERYGLALLEGRFTGQVILQLGGKASASLVPLTATMPRDLIGGPVITKEEMGDDGKGGRDKALVTRVLNLNGSDQIEVVYKDEKRPGAMAPVPLAAGARLITDGKLVCTDSEYAKDVTAVHVGERLYLKVTDFDADRGPDRDKIKVRITTKRGEDEVIELVETLAHSGTFTGSVLLKPVEKPTAGNIKPDAPELECYFGDTIEVAYADERAASTADGKLVSSATVAVVIGTNGKLQAFSKVFTEEQLAVETQFHIAESHFELFKSHKGLGREADARAALESGRRVLREVIEDYPNPKYTPRVSFLLGQFAQELKQYGEAVAAYQTVVKQYPDHTLAPNAQYKMAQAYEEAGEFNQALEAYVTLAATYPKNPLIADVMVRINDHFYKAENYKVAAQVGEKFLEKFEGHRLAPKMAFRVGQCYAKDKQHAKAAETFDKFVKTFREDPLAADAMFWAGESYRTANNMKKAFESYNKCRWDYPTTEAAKFARGRLALPEMLRQFEEASNGLDKN